MTLLKRNLRSRIAASLTAAAVALSGMLIAASPAQAATTTCTNSGCQNYGPWDSARSKSWWGNDITGTSTPNANCTNYAAWKLDQNGMGRPSINLGDANTWDDRARSMGVPVNGTPAVGAIAQWDTGTFGHVAYVEAVSGTTITVSESNWSGSWLSHRQMAVSEVTNFIHFRDVGQPTSPTGGSRVIPTVDFNGDGKSDVFRVTPGGTLLLYRGNGQGGWASQTGTEIGTGWNVFSKIVAPGDFNGDGKADLIGIQPSGSMVLYTGNGTGNWASQTGTTIGSGWQAFSSVVAPRDFSGDGKVDLIGVKSDGTMLLYKGNGLGGWLSGTGTQIGTGWNAFSQIVAPGDFTGDGKSDVIGVSGNDALSLYKGNGQSGWVSQAPAAIGSGFSIYSVLASAGDFDGDNKADLFGVKPNGELYLYQGNGTGGWKTGNGLLIGTGW